MDLQHNTFLRDRYRILEQLGKGGMGAVYLAQDTVLQTNVAVKINQNPRLEGREQFLHEARLLAALRHPNLPRVIDYFVIEESQFLVMDYVPGEDLGTIVHRDGVQPLDKVLHWAKQLGMALQYLHSQTPPVIHRDIKPANIKITPRGEVMLVDFGIAKSADVSQETSTGARGLTPGYSPPEQYGSARTGSYSDQYGLAATIYNLLTNQKPADSVERLLGQTHLAPARTINPQIPETIEAALEKALAVKPEDRYPSVIDFVEALMADSSNQADSTLVRPSRPVPPAATTAAQATRVGVGPSPSQPPPSQPPPSQPSAGYPPQPPPVYPSQPISQPLNTPGKAKWILPVVLVAAVAILAVLTIFIVSFLNSNKATPTATGAVVVINGTSTTAVLATETPSPTTTETSAPTETATIAPSATNTEEPTPTFTATQALEAIGRGGIVAFISSAAESATFQVWTMKVYIDADGNPIAGDKTQITTNPGDKSYPAWSPDGKRIVFSADSGDPTNKLDLWTMDPDGGNQTNILSIPGNETQSAWSPDGQWIVFTTDNRLDGTLQLMVVHPDGSGLKRISTDKQEFSAEWSPRMDKLVYVLPSANARYLWIRDPNNDFVDTEKNLAYGRLKYFDDPAWSPNGEWIAYTKVEGRTNDIYLFRVSSFGLEIKRLTNTTFDSYPAWSSDSEWILFTSNRDGNHEIYIMSIQGTQQTNLTLSANVEEMQPAWQIK